MGLLFGGVGRELCLGRAKLHLVREGSQCFPPPPLYQTLLAYTLLEPNFSNFHDIVRSSEVAVMAASGRTRIPQLECTQVNLIPQVIG